MIKVDFILFLISSSLLFWSPNHTSINEDSEWNALEIKNFFGEKFFCFGLIIDQMIY